MDLHLSVEIRLYEDIYRRVFAAPLMKTGSEFFRN